MCGESLVHWSADRAASLLSPLGNCWLHVQGVVERARQIGEAFNANDHCCLIAAAYLHDIGYTPALRQIGFHPIVLHLLRLKTSDLLI